MKKAAKDLESVFLHQLMKSMRATVREGKALGAGRGGALFSDLFDQAVSRSGQGRLGLADLIVNRCGGRLDVLAR